MVSERITETLRSSRRRRGQDVVWMPTGISNLDYDPKLDSAKNFDSIATSKSNKDKFIVWYLGDDHDEKSQKVRVNVLWNPKDKDSGLRQPPEELQHYVKTVMVKQKGRWICLQDRAPRERNIQFGT